MRLEISIKLILLIFLIPLITGACTSEGNIGTQTSLPTSTPTHSSTPTPTHTFTPTPTQFITWTPMPTLAPLNAQARFKEWLAGSPECHLPCWAGITPGETTWQEALYIVSSTLEIYRIYENHMCSNGPCNGFTWVYPFLPGIHGTIGTKGDNPVYSLRIIVEQSFDEISLDTFLSANGPPEKVYISTQTLFMSGETLPFDIVLAYPEKKFVIRFFRFARIQGDNIVSCGRIEATYLSLEWDEEGAWAEDRIKTATYSGGDKEIAYFLQDIEDVTDMTIEEFYDTLKADGDACISTPREYWP